MRKYYPEDIWISNKILMHKEVLNREHKLIHTEIEITRFCNHNCVFCFVRGQRSDLISENKYEKNKIFPTRRLLKLIRELKELGVNAISFTGAGEPLLHPDIDLILKEIIDNDIEFGITTNLNEDLSEDTLILLKEASWIRCSVNAHNNETYENIHGPKNNLTLDTTLKNIRYLVDKGTPIDISYVVCNQNNEYISDAIKLAESLNVKSITFRPVIKSLERGKFKYPDYVYNVLVRESTQHSNLIVNTGINRLKDSEEILEDIPCYYCNFSVFIATSGNVYPCCVSEVNCNYIYGNIIKSSFINLWNQSTNVYSKINMKYCPSCPHTKDNKILHMLYNSNINNFI